MIYFKDFKLYKYADDRGYILLQINGSDNVTGYLNDKTELIFESNSFNSSSLYIDIKTLIEGKNKITIVDNLENEIIITFLEVVINDKDSVC